MTIQLPDFLSAIEVNIQLANCSAIRLLLAIRLPDNRMPTVFSFFKCDAIFPGGTPGPAQLWRLGWLASTKPQISDAWNWMSSLQVPFHQSHYDFICHQCLVFHTEVFWVARYCFSGLNSYISVSHFPKCTQLRGITTEFPFVYTIVKCQCKLVSLSFMSPVS